MIVKIYIYGFFTVLLLFINTPILLIAQDTTSSGSQNINVYLDCRGRGNCDESYIRDEITFVNFVRNQDFSDVHILITTQNTGSGGEEFTLRFIGTSAFSEMTKVLTYYSAASDTESEIREGLNKYLKMGLFTFVVEQPIAYNFILSYEPKEVLEESATQSDKWDFWVFEVSADTQLEGEETEKEFSLDGEANIERITQDWKFQIEMNQDFERKTFEDDDTTRVFTTQSREANALVVKSFNEHWSGGITTRTRSSTRENIAFLGEGGFAFEYSIFPYREFAEREITFQYQVTGSYFDYDERTFYNQISEYLLRQQLSSNIQFTQPWGELEAEVVGSVYMHDVSKNRLDTELQLNFRLYRGLSFTVSGEYAWINDQLAVPVGDITDAEQLLDLRERNTSFSYSVNFGIELSFGSIYNNVVNPRM